MPATTDGWSRSSTGSYWVFTAHDLEKPDNDERQYRLIRLPNQLEALLIQDSNTDKASAALDVHVGNLSDPVSSAHSHDIIGVGILVVGKRETFIRNPCQTIYEFATDNLHRDLYQRATT